MICEMLDGQGVETVHSLSTLSIGWKKYGKHYILC